MQWRLLAFLPAAVVITAFVLLTASSLVAALEGSLDRNVLPSITPHPSVVRIDREIESRVELLEADTLEEHPAERATFFF